MSLQHLLIEAADILERNLHEHHAECIGARGQEAYEMNVVRRLRESAKLFDPTSWKLVSRRTRRSGA